MGAGAEDRPRPRRCAFDRTYDSASRWSVLIDAGNKVSRAEGDPLRAQLRTGGLAEPAGRVAWALVRFPEVWVLLLPGLYTALAMLSPLLRANGHGRLGAILFNLYRGWCHQFPQRTIFLEGFPMAICARCFALGAGVVLGALLAGRVAAFTSAPRKLKLPFAGMMLLALPMFLDGFSQLLGFRESTNTLRVATGGLFGAAVAFWVVPALYDAFDELRRNESHG